MNEVVLTVPNELVEAVADRVVERLGPPRLEQWVGVKEAAAHLACRPQRIYDLTSRGALPHRKDGSRLVFRLSELDRYLEDR